MPCRLSPTPDVAQRRKPRLGARMSRHSASRRHAVARQQTTLRANGRPGNLSGGNCEINLKSFCRTKPAGMNKSLLSTILAPYRSSPILFWTALGCVGERSGIYGLDSRNHCAGFGRAVHCGHKLEWFATAGDQSSSACAPHASAPFAGFSLDGADRELLVLHRPPQSGAGTVDAAG
jgi:hypothetical protein